MNASFTATVASIVLMCVVYTVAAAITYNVLLLAMWAWLAGVITVLLSCVAMEIYGDHAVSYIAPRLDSATAKVRGFFANRFAK